MRRHSPPLPLCLSSLVLFAALAFAPGCGDPPNSLRGSIGSSHDLTFDSTRLIRYETLEVQLEYLKELEGGGHDVVVKVVFTTPAGGIPPGEEIDLVENDGIDARVFVAGDAFPLDRGTILFEEGGNEPGPARGRFDVIFENGRTLLGTFDTVLEDVRFGD